MSYNTAFWFAFVLYLSQMTSYIFGAMAFVKYLLKRDR